jgi:hypothetical protein
MIVFAMGLPPMRQAVISVLRISSWTKSCEKPAAMPNNPPETVVAMSAALRPMRDASHTQNGPKGTAMILPSAASRPRWPLSSFRAAAMEGNRVGTRPASVLSTTLTPVMVARLRQRWGTVLAWTVAIASVSVGALELIGLPVFIARYGGVMRAR